MADSPANTAQLQPFRTLAEAAAAAAKAEVCSRAHASVKTGDDVDDVGIGVSIT